MRVAIHIRVDPIKMIVEEGGNWYRRKTQKGKENLYVGELTGKNIKYREPQ